jgi:hypothetical protein
MTKTILGTVAAAAIAIAAIAAAAKANASILDKIFRPKAVDFTLSLECRALESNENETIHYQTFTAVEIFERDRSNGVPRYDANGRLLHNDGVENYYPDARIAFDYGEPDGSSTVAVDEMRVIKVTPERITLHGQVSYGSRAGFIDRRTGHGEITWYQKYGKGEFWIGGEPDETVLKQWILECKPSAPAKF